MISGIDIDLLDSQESLFKQNVKGEPFMESFDSQESFSDLWMTSTLSQGKADEEITVSEVDVPTSGTSALIEDNPNIFNVAGLYPEADTDAFIEENPDIFNEIMVDHTHDVNSDATTSYDVDPNSSKSLNSVETKSHGTSSLAIRQDGVDTVSNSTNDKTKIGGKRCNSLLFNDPGHCGFSVRFMEPDHQVATKSIHFTYSNAMNKLYVQQNELCPIQFNCDANPPHGCYIKVMAVFKNQRDRGEIVKTCLLHKDCCSGDPNSTGRLIQVDMLPQFIVKYVTHEGNETVSIPYESANCGRDNQIIRFKFTCLSSCKSGINRRPTSLVFYLMTQEEYVIGRRVVDICICTRPGRDRKRDEKKTASTEEKKIEEKRVLKRPTTSTAGPQAKVTKDDKIYFLAVNGREKYEKLLQIKQAFDLAELVGEDQKKEYLKNEEDNQANH